MSSLKLTGWPRSFDCGHDERQARANANLIQAAFNQCAETLKPADPEYALAKVELLRNRGFQASKPEGIEQALYGEWLEDLSEYPKDLIDLACKKWRNSANKRAPYAAGELMESVKDEWITRRSNFMKAQHVLNLINEPVKPELYADPSPETDHTPKLTPKRVYREQVAKCRPINEQLEELMREPKP